MHEAKVPAPDLVLPPMTKDFHNWEYIIRYIGVVDFEGLYNLVCKWLRYRKFQVYEDLHKFKPPEIEIKLDCRRKKTSYKRDRINIHFHMFKNKDVEVLKGDKVVKMIDVRLKIKFSSFIETGYANELGWDRWQTSRFFLTLRNFINKHIIKKEIDMVDSDTLYYELYELHQKVKEYLDLEARYNSYSRSESEAVPKEGD